MLFFLHFPPPHTAENIKLAFDDAVSEHGVRIFCCVTDNAANIKKAVEVRLFPKPNSLSRALTLFNDSDESSDSNSTEAGITEPADRSVNSENLFEHSFRCAAHSLQLVVNDGLKTLENDLRAESALNKVKPISRLASKTTSFSYSLVGKVPFQPTVTCWNSEFRLLQHILSNYLDLNKALSSEDVSKKTARLKSIRY